MKNLFRICLIFAVLLRAAVAAESYIAIEAHTGRVLLAHNSEQKRPIASLTKVATAKVVLDWAKASGSSLAGMIVVPNSVQPVSGYNPLGLRPGEKISMRDAIYSALLGSDNVASQSLADHVGRQLLARQGRGGDPVKAFVTEMNHLAKALGMRRTRYGNPHGLDLPGAKGYSTASDTARLCIHAMRDTGFAFYVKQKSRKLTVVGLDGAKRSYHVKNTNQLLGQQGVNGIKTGTIAAAGQCLASNAHRKPLVKKLANGGSSIRKRDLVVVVLGSADRYARTRQLISQSWPIYDGWAQQGYPVSPKGRELIRVPKL